MTEYLINWNENKATEDMRKFDFSQDFFNFFTVINTCMLGDFNAWIHYAAKRFYGMLGDGQYGTTSGVVTKRGYIMAHFAKFITGMTRIDATWNGNSMESSVYLSQTGDTVVAVMANPDTEAVTLTVDLPFYTEKGVLYTTTKSKSFTKTQLNQEEETCRPVVTIAAQSVCTVLFVRSRDRQASDMGGTTTRFDRIDDMKTTKTTFGSTYKLSGKTKTFNSSNPLISTRTGITYGYVALSDRFSRLVMHINKVTSTNSLTIGAPTLIYVNSQGKLQKHEYERIDLSRGQNFDVVLDLSSSTLTDGCIGLISFTCDNAVSTLTINFGDVYLDNSSNYAAKLTGAYVADDSNVLDFTEDASCTSLDLTEVIGLPAVLPWLEGTNRVAYVAESSDATAANLVKGAQCADLQLSVDGGNFRPATEFTAEKATLTVSVEGAQLLMVPFEADVPAGVRAYTLSEDLTLQEVTTIAAHQPVVVQAQGEVTLCGSGQVAYAVSPLNDWLRGTYTSAPLYVGDYVLGQQDGQWGLVRLSSASTLAPFGVYAHPTSDADFLPIEMLTTGIEDVEQTTADGRQAVGEVYDLQGRRLQGTAAKGQLVIVRMADGRVRKVLLK